jgi:hypothetical protein
MFKFAKEYRVKNHVSEISKYVKNSFLRNTRDVVIYCLLGCVLKEWILLKLVINAMKMKIVKGFHIIGKLTLDVSRQNVALLVLKVMKMILIMIIILVNILFHVKGSDLSSSLTEFNNLMI